jgi:hypothetical protein
VAKIDMPELKGIKIDEVLGDLREEAGKRASSLFGESGRQVKSVRRAIADPNDGDMVGAFALGLAVGALIGAAIALLMTPVTGTEARRRLAERAEKLRGEPTPEWETGGTAGAGNGRTTYQTTPTYGAGTPAR